MDGERFLTGLLSHIWSAGLIYHFLGKNKFATSLPPALAAADSRRSVAPYARLPLGSSA
ncbi:MAG TPA: hypothetical protein VGT24_12130 [Candidatus Acidoferrales bacterium]|nr:hypothetical protein [Candidatus Acidoferrales bacterium]